METGLNVKMVVKLSSDIDNVTLFSEIVGGTGLDITAIGVLNAGY